MKRFAERIADKTASRVWKWAQYLILAGLPVIGGLSNGHEYRRQPWFPTAEIFVANSSGSIMSYARN
ncbi:MAG: hypothetical protein ACRETL_04310, partial [Gammaproteobacteria bacterium]